MMIYTTGRSSKTAGKFNKGGNNGTAVCVECKARRQRANMEGLVCSTCYEKAGDANSVADGYITEEEFVARWGHGSA